MWHQIRKFTSLAPLPPQRFKRKNEWGMGVGIAGISSIVKQCELLSLHRSRFYYEPVLESAKNLIIMRWLDEQYFETPFYGGLRLQVLLVSLGYQINIKRIRRLMKLVVWRTLYQEPRTTIADKASYK